MKGLWILLRANAYRVFGINKLRYERDKSARLKGYLTLAGFALVALMMLGMCGLYFYWMSIPLELMGMLDILPTLGMVAASLIILVTGIFRVNGVLFGQRDYDLLLSLPVPARTLVLSRILILYGSELFFTAFLLIPAGVVYAMRSAPGAMFYISLMLTLLLIPAIPIIVSAVIGLVIARFSVSFRYKNLVSIVLAFAVMIPIILYSFDTKGIMSLVENFGSIAKAVSESVYRMYPPSRWFAGAVTQNSFGSLLLFAAVSIAAIALFTFVLSKTYRGLNEWLTGVKKQKSFRLGKVRRSGLFKALFQKEWRRYTSSVLYVVNTAMGVILMTFACGAILFSGAEQVATILEMPQLGAVAQTFAPFLLCVLVAMTSTSSSAISMEGKHLWQLKVLPVDAHAVFSAKIAVNLVLTIPAIALNATLLVITLRPDFALALLYYIVPMACGIFTAQAGLIANLIWPKLDWTNEVQAIKQSMPVMVSIFGGMAITILPAVLVLNLSLDHRLSLLVVALLYALAAYASYRWLSVRGAKKFHLL
ncbi:MAG: hypothetical protein AAGU74_02775 [Bacillota bacterium]